MMTDLIWAATAVLITTILAAVLLRGWNGWLELRRHEIERRGDPVSELPSGVRIDLANVRERLRKLEAIARGVDP